MHVEEKHVETSPEHLAALCIVEAARESELAVTDPARWLLAISLLHRAVNCALVVALRGTHGLGAFSPELQGKWLRWLDAGENAKPPEQRVQSFSVLLERAQDTAEPEMFGEPLQLSEEEVADLHRLTAFRDDLEHMKPREWVIFVGGMPRIAGAAAEAFDQLMFGARPVLLHAPDDIMDGARQAVARLRALAKRYPSRPPDAS